MNVEALERACLEAWPARTRVQRDGWEFCATDDRSGRANAVWPLNWSGGDVQRAIADARAWCAGEAISPTFKLADGATAPEGLPAALAAAGFTPRTETLVMTRTTEAATPTFGVELHDEPSDDIWSPLNESAPDPADAAERRDIVNALTHWGAEEGAREAYLQVERANAAAIRLYENEGFSLAYSAPHQNRNAIPAFLTVPDRAIASLRKLSLWKLLLRRL